MENNQSATASLYAIAFVLIIVVAQRATFFVLALRRLGPHYRRRGRGRARDQHYRRRGRGRARDQKSRSLPGNGKRRGARSLSERQEVLK